MTRKRITTVLMGSLALAATCHTAWGAAYIKWEGFDGQVHEQEVLSVEWGNDAEVFEQASGDSAGAVVEELTLTMPYDKTAPKLFEYHRGGDVLPRLNVYGLNAGGRNEPIYIQYEVTNVMVSGFHLTAGLAGEPPVVVVVTLNFEEVTYTEQAGSSKSTGSIEVDFKLEVGQRHRSKPTTHKVRHPFPAVRTRPPRP